MEPQQAPPPFKSYKACVKHVFALAAPPRTKKRTPAVGKAGRKQATCVQFAAGKDLGEREAAGDKHRHRRVSGVVVAKLAIGIFAYMPSPWATRVKASDRARRTRADT